MLGCGEILAHTCQHFARVSPVFQGHLLFCCFSQEPPVVLHGPQTLLWMIAMHGSISYLTLHKLPDRLWNTIHPLRTISTHLSLHLATQNPIQGAGCAAALCAGGLTAAKSATYNFNKSKKKLESHTCILYLQVYNNTHTNSEANVYRHTY